MLAARPTTLRPADRAWIVVFAVLASLAGPSPAAPQASVPLRVMTFNIHAGQEGLEGVAATIREAAPDVVGLQEVDVHWSGRSRFVDQADSLARACGMAVRFGPIYTLPGEAPGDPSREFGVAILSRRPIIASKNHRITRLSTQSEGPNRPVVADLRVGGR